jgi:DNA-binding transcriptional LysR family regulator
MSWEERVGRRIKLRDLHVLIAIAEHGSMAKAAEHLAISHPVVSKTIAAMEHAIGVRILDRTARGVTLTAYGEVLLKSGIAVFDEMRQGIRHIEQLSDPTSGSFRFGCPEAMSGGLIQEVIARFMRAYPKVMMDVVPADTVAHNFRELRDREVEFLIGRVRLPFVDDELTAELLAHEGLDIVAGKANPLTARSRVELQELIDHPWVLPPPDSLPGAMARDLFLSRGLALPRINIVTMSLHLILAFASTGPHICVLPSSMLRYGQARHVVQALPVDLPPRESAIGVLTVKSRTISPFAMRFLDFAREVSAELSSVEING